MRRLFLVFACLLTGGLTGCRFSRTVVNAYVRDLDTSWIRAGVTTRDEVIARLGMSPAAREGGGVTKDSFRWVMVDTNGVGFEGGYIISPTFERDRQQMAEDILIRFDDRGVVSLLSRTRRTDGVLKIVDWQETGR